MNFNRHTAYEGHLGRYTSQFGTVPVELDRMTRICQVRQCSHDVMCSTVIDNNTVHSAVHSVTR